MITLHHRVWGFALEVVGYGNSFTGLCNIRRLDDGQLIRGVHYSELAGDGGLVPAAFYGPDIARNPFEVRRKRQAAKRERRKERARRKANAAFAGSI